MGKTPKVDFIGVGAARSGTTWLYNCLKEHPDVTVSSIKEVHFFDKDEHFNKGLPYYGKFFGRESTSKIVGEITPAYLTCTACPERIAQCFPQAKLILCLRNPVDRFISGYKYKIRRAGLLTEHQTLPEAIRSDTSLLEDGLYAKHLKRYLEWFPIGQIHIIFYGDISKRPGNVLRRVYTYLGVAPDFEPPSMNQIINSSEATYPAGKIPLLNELIYASGKRVYKSKWRQHLLGVLKRTGLYSLTKKVLQLNVNISRSSAKQSRHVTEEDVGPIRDELRQLYRTDVLELEGLLNRKTGWL